MHDPVGFLAFGGFASVEHERLLHAHLAVAIAHVDGLVGPSGLPVSARRGSVGPGAVGVLSVPRRKEIPFSLPEQRLVCSSHVTPFQYMSVQPKLD